ncbi:uncharacterized protein ACHE_50011A [Aspergillus chevalieri]|uniref:Uncharacterized protein n=1 Tax=Aspergillus chevalieri TaxID=182096 RepID=A0A7R7VQ75_ASPCH|nr:uncharacterized protein ACHE_50011A [Aspergillus chevalieri]BCR88813.1 hypothetical protein ACHE_50011A [Aspergillus chevalieri]
MAGRPENPTLTPSQVNDEDVRKSVPIRKKPTQEKGIKIYPFTIDKLCEENARYWFHVMENQLKAQFSWEAIEYYHEVGRKEFSTILREDVEWFKINLKADMIIEQGLQPVTILDIKDLDNAGLKWDRLKEIFLKSSNAKKAMKLMKMANWTWDSTRMNEKEAYREIKQLGKEFVDMNGGNKITIEELVVLWYLRGLGDKYATLRDTVMSSNVTLDEDYILNRIDDMMHMKSGSTEKGSRVSNHGNKKKKGSKCYVCGRAGHFARECQSKHEDSESDIEWDQQKPKGRREGRQEHRRGGRQESRREGRQGKSSKQKGRLAGEQDDDSSQEELCEFSSYAAERSELGRFTSEKGSQANGSCPSVWCFDSGATSMSTGNRDIFEKLDMKSRGTLTIASGVQMPILGRGTVKFNLPNGSATVRLSNVIYVPGLTENLLSLEALHVAGFESRGSIRGYTLLKDGKIVARGRRIGKSTYLDTVSYTNALYVKPEQARKCVELNAKPDERTILQLLSRRAVRADDETEQRREIIHQRLGHPGRKRFNWCVETMDMDELKVRKRDKLLDDDCEICVKAKQVKSQSHLPVPRARRPLQRVYMDYWGPYVGGVGEERYYLSLIDDCTRYSWVFIKKDRTSSSVQNTLELWLRQAERETGKMLLVIRTDNAKEFLALEPWAQLKGIQLEFTEPYTPPQNGVAERFNRFILEVTRALLFNSGISKRYWKYAVVTANYLRNRTTGAKGSGGKTPYELWHGYEPDLTHLRIWGCRVLYHQRSNDKLESRVMEGTFLLYGKSDKQYAVLPKGADEIRLVTNPKFREREPGYLTMDKDSSAFEAPMMEPATNVNDAPRPTPMAIDVESQQRDAAPLGGKEASDQQGVANGQSRETNESTPEVDGSPLKSASKVDNAGNEADTQWEEQHEVDAPLGEGHQKKVLLEGEKRQENLPQSDTGAIDEHQVERRHSGRTRQPSSTLMESRQTEKIYGRKRKAEGEDTGNSDRPAQRLRAHLARLAVATELLIGDREYEATEGARAAREKAGIRIPKSYNEAVNDPIYGSKWKEAIHKELSTLIGFGTWELKPRKEAEGTISSTRWVFDVKLGLDGRIDRFKARLVVRGNEQSDDDFDETFAPVFRLDSLRILVAIAALFGLEAHVLDAINAFAGSDLDKPNCMEIPEGLQDFDPEATRGLVLELKKSLYGLRQSANLWHRKISNFLKNIGFKSITADPSIFLNSRGLIIAVYVDDIVIFGKDVRDINTVKQKLKEFHPMTDSGLVRKLLGIRFTWGRDRSIRLDQEPYAQQILEEFGMADCKPASTPIGPSVKLETPDSSLLGRTEHKLFRRLIGRLIFLVIATRPDIAFAVNQLSQYLAEPREVHLAAAKHVLRYVKSTIGYGLTFGAKGSQGLYAYADSAYANSAKNRSTTGFVFSINGTPISWISRKQSVTAQSSTEAEYMAVSEAAKQAIWIRHFLYAIGKGSIFCNVPTTIYEDNQGAIKIADNPVDHPKTKHIAVRYHAIRDHIGNGEIQLAYLPTDKMIADGLTKAANHVSQGRLVEDLGLA